MTGEEMIDFSLFVGVLETKLKLVLVFLAVDFGDPPPAGVDVTRREAHA